MPSTLSEIAYRLRALFRRRQMEAELDEELRAHLTLQTARHVRAGIPPEAAARRARLELGGLERTKEQCRDARGVRLVETLLQDAGHGLRMLRRNPGFAAVTVLTLGLGIGWRASWPATPSGRCC